MDINSLKLSVVQKVVDTKDESVLMQINQLLSASEGFILGKEDLNLLEERRNRYITNKGDSAFSWEEVQAMARDAIKRPV